MPSRINNPSAGNKIIGVFQVGEGGHGEQTARPGLLALGGFPLSDIGGIDQCIPLNGDGLIDRAFFGDLQVVETGIDGPTSVARGSLNIYTLTTFDTNMAYVISAERGTVELKGKLLYYRAPMSTGVDTITVDGRTFNVDVLGVEFVSPVITSPLGDADGNFVNITFMSSTAEIKNNPGTEQHDSSDWELSELLDFSTLYRYSYQTSELTSWAVTGLQQGHVYYARVRYNGRHGSSEWSGVRRITVTTPVLVTKPQIIFPINQAFIAQEDATILSSAFATEGYTDTHQSSDWVVSTTANFGNVISESNNDTVNLISFTPPELLPMTLYYAKVRYRGAERLSDWSDAISFVVDYDE